MDHPLHGAQVLLPQVGAVWASKGYDSSFSITFQVRPFLHDLSHLSVILPESVDLIRDFSPRLLLGFSRHALVKLSEDDVSVPLYGFQQQFDLSEGKPRFGL